MSSYQYIILTEHIIIDFYKKLLSFRLNAKFTTNI